MHSLTYSFTHTHFRNLVAAMALLAPACGTGAGEKEPVAEASQSITKNQLAIVGSLAYGQTSSLITYTKRPRYVAFELTGKPGDEIDVWVKSANGDPLALIVDDDLRLVALNDDASRFDTNAHIQMKLPPNASAKHYVVVRDYWLSKMTFTVTLGGGAPDSTAGCNVDADCARIEKGCCPVGEYIAVPTADVDAYQASLGCAAVSCARILVLDDQSVAQCNVETHKCEVVKPNDIACNGFTMNSHKCPDGWQCRLPDFVADVPGRCVQHCGGFAGKLCLDPDDQCVDDPADDCNPNRGGADCMGVCASAGADCRTIGCASGMGCASGVSGAWSCVPQADR